MHPLFADIKNFTFDTLFPITCLSCNEPGTFVCHTCLSSFAKLEHQRCIICQKPSLHGMTHASCMSANSPDGSLSMFDYHDERIATVLIQGKYKFLPNLYIPLGYALTSVLATEGLRQYVSEFTVCPVPLHAQRQRWRGFNQSEILGRAMSERLSLSFEPTLVRVRATKTQKDLNKESRSKNVSGSFALYEQRNQMREILLDWLFNYDKPPRIKMNVHGKSILLVDDVITTGSTLIEAAKTLKQNGAKQVWCITVARD